MSKCCLFLIVGAIVSVCRSVRLLSQCSSVCKWYGYGNNTSNNNSVTLKRSATALHQKSTVSASDPAKSSTQDVVHTCTHGSNPFFFFLLLRSSSVFGVYLRPRLFKAALWLPRIHVPCHMESLLKLIGEQKLLVNVFVCETLTAGCEDCR